MEKNYQTVIEFLNSLGINIDAFYSINVRLSCVDLQGDCNREIMKGIINSGQAPIIDEQGYIVFKQVFNDINFEITLT